MSWSLYRILVTKAIQIKNNMYGLYKINSIKQIMEVIYELTKKGNTTVKCKFLLISGTQDSGKR